MAVVDFGLGRLTTASNPKATLGTSTRSVKKPNKLTPGQLSRKWWASLQLVNADSSPNSTLRSKPSVSHSGWRGGVVQARFDCVLSVARRPLGGVRTVVSLARKKAHRYWNHSPAAQRSQPPGFPSSPYLLYIKTLVDIANISQTHATAQPAPTRVKIGSQETM
ncbi:hypothetical protein BGZ63DRAFT_13532 [Mariannaea sp. PMI_226]|nr:hypothetical protein BGZ63DRAFT_13532 [Mariannaea sp. PMI_226]